MYFLIDTHMGTGLFASRARVVRDHRDQCELTLLFKQKQTTAFLLSNPHLILLSQIPAM